MLFSMALQILYHKYCNEICSLFLFRALEKEVFHCSLEKRPSDLTKKRDKPDIAIHDNIILNIDGTVSQSKYYFDTIIYDIYRNDHVEFVKKALDNDNDGKCKMSLFSAGKLGEQDKIRDYRYKFEMWRNNNYKFVPISVEFLGGISKKLKKLINYIIIFKAKRTGKDKAILLNNFYIEMEMNYKKLMLERLYAHINI